MLANQSTPSHSGLYKIKKKLCQSSYRTFVISNICVCTHSVYSIIPCVLHVTLILYMIEIMKFSQKSQQSCLSVLFIRLAVH